MSRREFIEELKIALSAELGSYEVNDNISYYEEYIESELKKGMSEEEIFKELGEPRLIAKTIMDTAKLEEKEETREYGDPSPKNIRKKAKFPTWLIIILVLLVIFVITRVAFTLFFKFLPFILIIMAVSYIIKLFRS